MARIQPISLRLVDSELTGEVPSPPHDAMSVAARRHHLETHPRSYLGVTRMPEDIHPGSVDPAEAALVAGRRHLERLLDDGVFGPPGPPGLFIYRLQEDDHRQTGLVCGVATADYDDGTVRIHERINRTRAAQLARHLSAVGAQSSPITMAFKSRPAVVDIIERTVGSTEPLLDFIDDEGLRQQLWAIADAGDIERIRFALAGAPLYLIDGHHRAAAASADRAESPPEGRDRHQMLATLFPYEELRNQAFHRLLIGVDTAELQSGLAERFACRFTDDPEVVAARGVSELALGLPSDRSTIRWMLFDLPFDPHAPSDLDNIDPIRLADRVLGPILGIDEAGSDPRLSYRPGPDDEAAIAGFELGPDEAVFLMRAVPMDILMDASDEGLVMPPKSTYFMPKVRSGLFVQIVDPLLD